MCELAFVAAIQARDIEVIEMLEIVGEISHLPAPFTLKACTARERQSDRRNLVCRKVRAKNMGFAFNSGRKRSTPGRGQSSSVGIMSRPSRQVGGRTSG